MGILCLYNFPRKISSPKILHLTEPSQHDQLQMATVSAENIFKLENVLSVASRSIFAMGDITVFINESTSRLRLLPHPGVPGQLHLKALGLRPETFSPNRPTVTAKGLSYEKCKFLGTKIGIRSHIYYDSSIVKKKKNNERRETIEKRGGGPRREVTSGSGLRVSEENDGRVLFSSL